MTLSPDYFNKWIRKRKKTLIAFTFQNILIGMEFSLTFITLWLYLEKMVKPPNPKMYYGIISSSYLLVSMTSSVLIGRAIDHNRNVKAAGIICNALAALGNILYAFPFSPVYLLIGRLLSGFGGPMRSVISGELARVYPTEKLLSKYSIMGMAYSLGFVVGPAINFVFKTVDLHVGFWHITYMNLPSLFLAVLFASQAISSVFVVHNLSKEYDLKGESLSITNEVKNVESVGEHCTVSYFKTEKTPLVMSENKEMPPMMKVLKQLFSKLPTSLLLFSAFFENYFVVSFDMWLPLIVVDVLHWSVVELNMIVLLTGISCVAACLLLIFKPPTDRFIFRMAILSTFSIILMESTFMVLSYITSYLPLSVLLWIFFAISYCFLIITEEIFLVGCLAKMVSSKIQTYVDSIRLSMYRLGGLVALATSALIFDHILIVGTIHVVVVLVGLVLLIFERESLKNPKIIIQ